MSIYASGHPLARISRRFNPFLAFVQLYTRLDVQGLERIPAAGAFILAANHNSHADTAAVFASLPRTLRGRVITAAAQDYFFTHAWRRIASRVLFNAVPVERSAAADKDPLRHVIRALREGDGVLLFPEGTRSATGELGPFRSGIGRLIAEFPDAAVIPIWLDGAARALPKGAVLPRPYKVTVRFGPPLPSLQADPEDSSSWHAAAQVVRSAVFQLSQSE